MLNVRGLFIKIRNLKIIGYNNNYEYTFCRKFLT